PIPGSSRLSSPGRILFSPPSMRRSPALSLRTSAAGSALSSCSCGPCPWGGKSPGWRISSTVPAAVDDTPPDVAANDRLPGTCVKRRDTTLTAEETHEVHITRHCDSGEPRHVCQRLLALTDRPQAEALPAGQQTHPKDSGEDETDRHHRLTGPERPHTRIFSSSAEFVTEPHRKARTVPGFQFPAPYPQLPQHHQWSRSLHESQLLH